eukprot:s1683_g2.t1
MLNGPNVPWRAPLTPPFLHAKLIFEICRARVTVYNIFRNKPLGSERWKLPSGGKPFDHGVFPIAPHHYHAEIGRKGRPLGCLKGPEFFLTPLVHFKVMLTQTTRQKTCCGILRKDAEARSEYELTLLAAVMREVPQFQQLDGASLKAICRTMELKRFAKGDVIVQEGDHGSEFYVLIRGAVSIYNNRPEEPSGQEPRPRVLPRCIDYTVAQQASDFKIPEIKAKSPAHVALNRRISYTVEWEATEKANLEGKAGEAAEAESQRRVSAVEEGTHRKCRGSSFTDSESEEDAEDVTQMLRNAKSVPPGRVTRRLSSDKEQLEEKSPRRAGLRSAALLPGSSFGEFSLLSTQLPRQSTAKCEEKSFVAILRRQDYQQILEKTRSSRRSEWMAFAQAAPILRSLEKSTRLLLEPLVKIQQVSMGQKVVKIGDPVQVLFLAKGIFAVAAGEADSEAVSFFQLAWFLFSPENLCFQPFPHGAMAVRLWGAITGWEVAPPHGTPVTLQQGGDYWLSSWPSLAVGAGGILALGSAVRHARRAQRRPKCCPPGALGATACRAGASVPSLRGEVETLPGGLDAYVVGKGNSRAVLVASDIFGIHQGRHKEVCDVLAEEGFLVILPDFFHGAPKERSGGFLQGLQQAVSLWTPLNTSWSRVEHDLSQAVLPYLEQQGCALERCALLGFCWGAWLACHACGAWPNFCCAAMAHPSVHNMAIRWGEDQDELLRKVKVPQLVLSSKDEPGDWKPGGKAEEVFKKNSAGVWRYEPRLRYPRRPQRWQHQGGGGTRHGVYHGLSVQAHSAQLRIFLGWKIADLLPSAGAVTSALMAPPSCFGLSAHCRNVSWMIRERTRNFTCSTSATCLGLKVPKSRGGFSTPWPNVEGMKPKMDLVQRELQGVKPLTQCGCGCSLTFGVALILLTYLVRSIYMLVVTAGEVVVQDPRFESTQTLEEQTFNAFVALFALPFILSGFYALHARYDSYLRPFMYFMIAAGLTRKVWISPTYLGNDALRMVLPMWMHGSCAFVPEGLKATGAAGACGFIRVLFVIFFGQLAAVEAYFIFAVWSLCEDMKVNLKSSLPEMYERSRASRSDYVGPAEALHFEESLTSCSAAGKLYVLQTKHLWMMLSSHQQDALTRAASYERWFHLARATVMRALNPPLADARSRQLYAASSRLGVLRDQLQKPQDGTCEEDSQGVGRMLARSWSKESLQVVVENSSRREKLPRLEPDLSRVAATEVPKTRLHSSLLPLWSPNVLVQRQSLHLGQQQGVFHGYGPAVQANRFITQFFKVHTGPWSHACQSSASHSSPPAQLQPAATGEEEEFFEAFEEDGSMSPLLDAKIKETVRQRRLQEEWRNRADKAAATLQSIVRRFLRQRRKQNHAATCIQRAFRSRQSLETPLGDTPVATPSPTPEAGLSPADEGKHPSPDQTPIAHHGSILQLDLDAAPKLKDLKKALGRAKSRSWRTAKPFHEEVVPAETPQSPRFPSTEVPQLFVPLDLIEKHQLLMETQVLEEWPNADRLPTLKRLRRKWEKLHRKPDSSTELVVAPPTDLADLGAWKLPVLPSPKGTMVFSARLSAAHPDYVSNWNQREMEKDEIDPAEIYRPKPTPPRFRSKLRRYG